MLLMINLKDNNKFKKDISNYKEEEFNNCKDKIKDGKSCNNIKENSNLGNNKITNFNGLALEGRPIAMDFHIIQLIFNIKIILKEKD